MTDSIKYKKSVIMRSGTINKELWRSPERKMKKIFKFPLTRPCSLVYTNSIDSKGAEKEIT